MKKILVISRKVLFEVCRKGLGRSRKNNNNDLWRNQPYVIF